MEKPSTSHSKAEGPETNLDVVLIPCCGPPRLIPNIPLISMGITLEDCYWFEDVYGQAVPNVRDYNDRDLPRSERRSLTRVSEAALGPVRGFGHGDFLLLENQDKTAGLPRNEYLQKMFPRMEEEFKLVVYGDAYVFKMKPVPRSLADKTAQSLQSWVDKHVTRKSGDETRYFPMDKNFVDAEYETNTKQVLRMLLASQLMSREK